MSPKVFIDGEHGTTGLQIRDRLTYRDDVKVLSLPHEARRDEKRRLEMFGETDVVILCLPDDAAREAVSMIEETGNSSCRIIDTSTAHRTHPEWAFGFAELDQHQSDKIRMSKRVSNPGCYSTGAIALLKPLIDAGIMNADFPVTINAVSGYTGGGKQLIAQMEDLENEAHIETAFHLYALGLKHKHVPEIMARSGLNRRPIFTPSVARFRQGMLVSVPLHLDQLEGSQSRETVYNALCGHYAGQETVSVSPLSAEVAHIRPEDFAGLDTMKLHVLGDPTTGHVNLVAQLDNLGKGASGAAVQNLMLMIEQEAQDALTMAV